MKPPVRQNHLQLCVERIWDIFIEFWFRNYQWIDWNHRNLVCRLHPEPGRNTFSDYADIIIDADVCALQVNFLHHWISIDVIVEVVYERGEYGKVRFITVQQQLTADNWLHPDKVIFCPVALAVLVENHKYLSFRLHLALFIIEHIFDIWGNSARIKNQNVWV